MASQFALHTLDMAYEKLALGKEDFCVEVGSFMNVFFLYDGEGRQRQLKSSQTDWWSICW